MIRFRSYISKAVVVAALAIIPISVFAHHHTFNEHDRNHASSYRWQGFKDHVRSPHDYYLRDEINYRHVRYNGYQDYALY